MELWSDEEIRKALCKHNLCQGVPLTSSTRPFLLRKLQNILNTPSLAAPEPNTASDSVEIEASKPASSTSSGTPKVIEPEGYYGVAAMLHTPNHGESDSVVQLSPFYTSKSDALKAIKGMPGARFKKFNSKAAAEEYSQQNTVEEIVEETDSPLIQVHSSALKPTSEKANNFPSIKTQDLSKFRIMIEEGDVESFLDCIQRNPRYLITAGDAPEILKPPLRYNALHCAVLSGQLEICKNLLWIIQDDDFWARVYPDDSEVTRSSRKEHLLDLYLNMQDKGFGETPLHFACKLGYIEIVSLLLTFPLTSISIKSKDGKTPAEIVCQKTKSSSPEVKARIEELLREPEIFYVPVLRTEDNSTPPRLGHPVTLEQLDGVESQIDGCELPEVSNGLAGPMSPSDARQFYQEWRSPNCDSSERKKLARVKRSDSERGLERIGRQLAHKSNVGWVEYWDFLGCSCDLSKPEGLSLLEGYLGSKANSTNESSTEDCENPLLSPPGTNMGESDKVSRRLFKEDETEEAGVGMKVEPQANASLDTEDLSELFSKKLSLQENLFISGSGPTKLDSDVCLALCNVSPDPSKYPHVAKWLSLLDGFTEDEKKSWKTPRKQPLGVSHTPSSYPVSPLVFSSPSVQTYSGSSPLVTSGPSQGKSMNSANSLNMTPTPRYWQKQSITPRGKNTFAGSSNTTPRRHGQARVTTPTRYGKLSFTPKIL